MLIFKRKHTSIPNIDEGIPENFSFNDLFGSKIPEIDVFDIILLKHS